jgi:hypothetical protein
MNNQLLFIPTSFYSWRYFCEGGQHVLFRYIVVRPPPPPPTFNADDVDDDDTNKLFYCD